MKEWLETPKARERIFEWFNYNKYDKRNCFIETVVFDNEDDKFIKGYKLECKKEHFSINIVINNGKNSKCDKYGIVITKEVIGVEYVVLNIVIRDANLNNAKIMDIMDKVVETKAKFKRN